MLKKYQNRLLKPNSDTSSPFPHEAFFLGGGMTQWRQHGFQINWANS